MRVKWLRTALANLNAEAEYISHDSPAAAAGAVATILDAVERLKQYPALGAPGGCPALGSWWSKATPYIVPYRVRGDAVELLRVFHAARKWPDQL